MIARDDPDAVIAVFTADHHHSSLSIGSRRSSLRDSEWLSSIRRRLVTFGIAPTQAAIGYGYLELGESLAGTARIVRQFKEKPDEATAKRLLCRRAGALPLEQRHVRLAGRTLLECIRRYEPANAAGLARVAAAWGMPEQAAVLSEVYPALRKISVDFAVMEPASRDPAFRVAAVPMPLEWLDVGSWPMFAETCPRDEQQNTLAAERHVLLDTRRTLVASSDPRHLIATIGCEDLIVIHTPEATLVCRADRAEQIKKVHGLVGERFGKELL